MISIIILIISFILDGILSSFLPYSVGNLSLFTPLLTIVSLFIIYKFYYHKEKEYYIIAFILGIIYDLFYTNLLFFNGLVFLLMAYLFVKIYRVLKVDSFRIIIYICLVIIFYEVVCSIVFLIFNLVPITFNGVLYKITHSLLLNIIYGELLYVIINAIPKKYLKISIN